MVGHSKLLLFRQVAPLRSITLLIKSPEMGDSGEHLEY